MRKGRASRGPFSFLIAVQQGAGPAEKFLALIRITKGSIGNDVSSMCIDVYGHESWPARDVSDARPLVKRSAKGVFLVEALGLKFNQVISQEAAVLRRIENENVDDELGSPASEISEQSRNDASNSAAGFGFAEKCQKTDSEKHDLRSHQTELMRGVEAEVITELEFVAHAHGDHFPETRVPPLSGKRPEADQSDLSKGRRAVSGLCIRVFEP